MSDRPERIFAAIIINKPSYEFVTIAIIRAPLNLKWSSETHNSLSGYLPGYFMNIPLILFSYIL